MIDLTTYIIGTTIWILATIVFHEAGHYLYAKLLGFKPKFMVSKKGFSVDVPGVEEGSSADKNILIGGILFGFIPTLLYMVWADWYMAIAVFIGFSIGHYREVKMLVQGGSE